MDVIQQNQDTNISNDQKSETIKSNEDSNDSNDNEIDITNNEIKKETIQKEHVFTKNQYIGAVCAATRNLYSLVFHA